MTCDMMHLSLMTPFRRQSSDRKCSLRRPMCVLVEPAALELTTTLELFLLFSLQQKKFHTLNWHVSGQRPFLTPPGVGFDPAAFRIPMQRSNHIYISKYIFHHCKLLCTVRIIRAEAETRLQPQSQ